MVTAAAGRIHLRIPYEDRFHARRIPGAQFHKESKTWSFPTSEKSLIIHVFPETKDYLSNVIEKNKRASMQAQKCLRERKQAVADHLAGHSWKMHPYEHQVRMIVAGIAHRKYAFLAEMGTGKSKVVCDIVGVMKASAIIICPKSVMENWKDEFYMSTDIKPAVLDGTMKKRVKTLKDNSDGTVIINYEGLLSMLKLKNKDAEAILKSFKVCVLDESSKIKSPKAQRSKRIVKTFQATPFKYILSGTPITQSPLDIYQQFAFLDPNFLGYKTYLSFRNEYADMTGYGNYTPVFRKHLMPKLKKIISAHAFQIKKEDCLDLPEKTYTRRLIEMSKGMRDQYESMKNDMIVEMEGQDNVTAGIILTKLVRLQEIASGVYLQDQKDNEKMAALEEILEERGDQKVIVWCRFRNSLACIARMLEEKGIRHCEFHGDTKERNEVIKDFQAGKYDVFLGQIQTGGMGITLTAATMTVYYENTFSLEDRLQSEARNHRAGQTEKVTYIDLVYKRSIDEHIFKAISKKQDVAKNLVSCFEGGDF